MVCSYISIHSLTDDVCLTLMTATEATFDRPDPSDSAAGHRPNWEDGWTGGMPPDTVLCYRVLRLLHADDFLLDKPVTTLAGSGLLAEEVQASLLFGNMTAGIVHA